MVENQNNKSKFSTYIVVLPLLFIAFTVGGIYASINTSGNIFARSWVALKSIYSVAFPSLSRAKASSMDKGVITHDPSKAIDGYTLFSTTKEPKISLIDIKGNVVHEWNLKQLEEIYKEYFFDNSNTVVRDAVLYPNGDVIFVIAQFGKTPWGAGVAKADKDGNILWTFESGKAHHDLSTDEEGNIYTLTHQYSSVPVGTSLKTGYQFDLGDATVLEDQVTILSPTGEEIKTFSLLDALFDSPYKDVISNYKVKDVYDKINKQGREIGEDWQDAMHANTIQYVTKDIADNVDYLEPGQLIVNLLKMNLVVIVDPETEKVVWATSGPWLYPHQPEVLSNGNIMIFDNQGIWPKSRVIEYDPKTKEIVWEYKGTDEKPLKSRVMGRQQILDNKNVLITESLGGRLVEVDRGGDIVWEYSNPERVPSSDDSLTWRFIFGYRYKPHEIPFLLNKEEEK